MISGCSGRRRKRELGIAAPSPFPYFLSLRAPARARPGGGAAGAAANRPAVRAGPSGRGGAAGAKLREAPAPSSSPRAAVPLGTDSGAGPRSRPWRRPGLGHSGTRSSPGAPAPDPPRPPPQMREEEPSPRGNPAAALLPPAAPGNPAEPSALPAHAAHGTSDHPVSPCRRGAPSPWLPAAPGPSRRASPRVPRRAAPTGPGSRRAAPASRGPAPPAHHPAPAARSRFPPSRPRGGSPPLPRGRQKAATCPWGKSPPPDVWRSNSSPRAVGGPSCHPLRRRQAPLPPAPGYLLSSPSLPSVGSDPQDG